MQQTTFPNDSHEATIQDNSMILGRLFRQAYANGADNTLELLERYKETRRKLPRDPATGHHKGYKEAYPTTQYPS